MKVILAHDSFTQLGGAERVVLGLAEMFPNSPIYTLVADKKILRQLPENVRHRIRTTPLQYLYNAYPKFQHLLPFIPLALWLTKIPWCDILLSSSSAFAKGFKVNNRPRLSLRPLGHELKAEWGVRDEAIPMQLQLTKGLPRLDQSVEPRNDRTFHINYCHTPTRFLWTDEEYFHQEVPWMVRWPARIFLWWMKKWDIHTAKDVDVFIANSKEVQGRIKKIYGREAQVVYPFVDTNFWKPTSVIPCHDTGSLQGNTHIEISTVGEVSKDSGSGAGMTKKGTVSDSTDEKYFLLAGRLHAHKDNDLVIKACNELGLNLHVVGSGRDEAHLKKIAGHTIKFLGRVSDERLREEFVNALAFIFPQLEDFGLMPLEAAATGTPTIGADKGGTLETVIPGITGELFKLGDKDDLKSILRNWDKSGYDMEMIQAQAKKFGKDRFISEIKRMMNTE